MPSASEEPREEYIEEPNTASEPKEDIETAGCSFSIYPLNANYIEIIRSALDSVGLSKVWHKTDDVGTVIRGRISHMFDITRDVFLQAAQSGEHVTLRAMYSIGGPGETTDDINKNEDHEPIKSSADISRPVSVKFALYPLGKENSYIDIINNQIKAIKEMGISASVEHYETRLEGDAEELFGALEKVFRNTEMSGSVHTVMMVTAVAHNIENR
ncbi:MAG TPA: YkoF family thiamine/hydroxymethylpyrimidine-binding protein [Balneolaceae bacterium]|nr:YkoF family thiamine/hydroxymethylpyrimidine-binding protein [Balneolaceae bacterium]